jgi:hypothetical protein
MTAEVAIMNKEAIALAADSAVTIDTASGRKIFNTVNKLFSLSKYAPIGIMVYGRAEMMGIPWESIIKVYRARIAGERFRSLGGYKEHFISFLRKSTRLFPLERQQQYFKNVAFGVFQRIRAEVEREVRRLIKVNGKASESEIRKVIDDEIEAYTLFVKNQKRIEGVTSSRAGWLKKKYISEVASARKTVFEELPLSLAAIKNLEFAAIETCCRRVFHLDSGVVIAGFGDEDIFPRLYSMNVGGIADGILRYDIIDYHRVDFDDPAVIIPFAQSDMVATFMEGIDPAYRRVIMSFLDAIFRQYPTDALSSIPSLSTSQKSKLNARLKSAGQGILKSLDEELHKYQEERHVRPVVQAIEVLSKDLLAEVAESLVSLTSFKRRISMNSAETVGGPIDVAVISRGDGFIWIKRKHYFKSELNPHFLANYFGGNHGTGKQKS